MVVECERGSLDKPELNQLMSAMSCVGSAEVDGGRAARAEGELSHSMSEEP